MSKFQLGYQKMQTRDEWLAEKITDKITNNSSKTTIDAIAAVKTIVNMLQFAELRPILEFFASDSDNFFVIIDTEKDFRAYSNGISFSSDENIMHIDGKQSNNDEENKEAIRKSLLFGLCKYTIKKVFNNDGKPYALDIDKNHFLSLCRNNSSDADHIIPFITDVEMHNVEKCTAIQTDVLPYIAKFIWQDKSTRKVAKLYPELTDYYYDKFIPAINNFLQKRKDDQPSLFKPAAGTTLFIAGQEVKIKPVRVIKMAQPVDSSSYPSLSK